MAKFLALGFYQALLLSLESKICFSTNAICQFTILFQVLNNIRNSCTKNDKTQTL